MPIFIIHHIKHLITCTTLKTALRNDSRIKRYVILKFGKIHTQQGSLSGTRQKRNPLDPRSADLKRRQTEANYVRTSAQRTPPPLSGPTISANPKSVIDPAISPYFHPKTIPDITYRHIIIIHS